MVRAQRVPAGIDLTITSELLPHKFNSLLDVNIHREVAALEAIEVTSIRHAHCIVDANVVTILVCFVSQVHYVAVLTVASHTWDNEHGSLGRYFRPNDIIHKETRLLGPSSLSESFVFENVRSWNPDRVKDEKELVRVEPWRPVLVHLLSNVGQDSPVQGCVLRCDFNGMFATVLPIRKFKINIPAHERCRSDSDVFLHLIN